MHPDPSPPWTPADESAMRLALDQAHNAWLVGEVPVGAVIVRHGPQGPQVIATGYNRPITTHDPTAHAEIVALRHAAGLLENYRLADCDLYVTLEPCAMCAMALMHARLRRVVFAAPDPKTGVAGSVLDLFGVPQLNHHTRVQGGLLAEPCARLLREFFAERRAAQKALQQARREAAGGVLPGDALGANGTASGAGGGMAVPLADRAVPRPPAEAAGTAPTPDRPTGDATELSPDSFPPLEPP